MNINNLNSFNEHKIYYDFYTKNNNKLNNIVQNIIKKYIFDYEPEKYYRLNEKNIRTRNIYELSGIIIMLNSIIEKNVYGYCIKTGKKYKCEKMCYSNNNLSKFSYTSYHFNCSNDEFIIVFGWEYFSPMYIYYPKNNLVFNISYRFCDIKRFINESNINYNISHYPINNFISYSFGMIHNAGHHFWQEIYGLMLLFEYDLINNIDEFIVYKYDYLNMSEILKNKYNKKITYINSDKIQHNITVNLSKHYINNSSIDLFKNIYHLKENSQNNQINIVFDIRTNDRIWLNQLQIIVNIMNVVKNTYINYDVNFFISGFYNYENDQNTNGIYNSKKEVIKQNKLFNIIKSCVSFPIYSLINLNLSQLIKFCQKVDMCIANAGSGISFFYQTIFNKHSICITLNKKTYDFNLQRYAFENFICNNVFLQSKYIIDKNNNFYVKPGYLLPLVIEKLNNLIINKQT